MHVVELFCGVGGMSLGLKQAGFSVSRAYDNSRPALAVYEANLRSFLANLTGEKKTRLRNLGGIDVGKLKQIDAKSPNAKAKAVKALIEELEAVGDLLSLIPEILQLAPDLIAGGPPCQPWSQMGPRLGDGDPRARLTTAFATVIAAVRPKYFLMENVKQIQRYKTFKDIRAMLKKAGYGITEIVLDASHYGVAQARERFLMIGCQGECDGWLTDHIVALKSQERTTVADVLGSDFGMPHYCDKTRDGKKIWRAAGSDTVEPTVNFFWLSPAYKNTDIGSTRTDRPAPTILKNMLRPRHPAYPPKGQDVEDVHVLPVPTFQELAQIAGFPATWDWSAAGSTDQNQALTNAVPPPMAALVGRCIIAHERGDAPLSPVRRKISKEFLAWLQEEKGLSGSRLTQTASEYKAVRRFFGSRRPQNYESGFAYLNGLPVFQKLGASRKSNLRRAFHLYTEYYQSRWGRQDQAPITNNGELTPFRPGLGRIRRTSAVPIVPEMLTDEAATLPIST